MTARAQHRTFMEADDVVRIYDGAQSVRNHQRCAVHQQCVECLHNFRLSLGIERACRFVENDDGAFEARSVTNLMAGERLRVQHAQKGTHVGRRISARVEER